MLFCFGWLLRSRFINLGSCTSELKYKWGKMGTLTENGSGKKIRLNCRFGHNKCSFYETTRQFIMKCKLWMDGNSHNYLYILLSYAFFNIGSHLYSFFRLHFWKNEIKLISSCIHCLQRERKQLRNPTCSASGSLCTGPSYYLCPRIHYLLDIYRQRAQKPLSDQWRHGRFIHEKEPWQSGYSYNRKNTHTWIHSVHGVCPKLWWVLNLFCINLFGDHFAGEGGPIRQALSAFAKITSSTVSTN